MKKINWCKKQIKGIQFIEPNNNLSEEYFAVSEENLKTSNKTKDLESNM